MQCEIRRRVELLAMAENTYEARGIFLEHLGFIRSEFAAAQHETVEAFAALKPVGAQRFAERPAQTFTLFERKRETALEGFRHAVDFL